MSDDAFNGSRRHPIKVVARRTGLTPDVIRIWERRYHAVQPARAEGSRRLYTDEEVERLRLLRRGTLAGRRISELAALATPELRTVVEEDEAATAGAARGRESTTSGDGSLDEAMGAIHALDARGLLAALLRSQIELGDTDQLSRMIIPLLDAIGAAHLGRAEEQLAIHTVRAWLQTAYADRQIPTGAPEIVTATLGGQYHELGALIAAVAAEFEGWRATYLGPAVAPDEIARAARLRGARAVALSFGDSADPGVVAGELRRLRDSLGNELAIIAGGQAVEAFNAAIETVDGRAVSDLTRFRRLLESLRYER